MAIIHSQESSRRWLFLWFLFATNIFIVRNTKGMTNIQTILFLLQFSLCICENNELDSDVSTLILKKQ